MKTHTIVLLSLSLSLASACSWSAPCDAWYSPGECVDDDQGGGETGEEDNSSLLCPPIRAQLDFCAVESSVDPAPFLAAGYVPTSPDACESSAENLSYHVEGWHMPVDENYTGRVDAFCVAPDGGGKLPYYAADLGHAISESPWRLCRNTVLDPQIGWWGSQKFYPAANPDSLALDAPSNLWPSIVDCGEYTDPKVGTCHLGLVAVGGMDPSAYNPGAPEEWTCACESDSDCQAGSICEAGWALDGLIPGPTLCTWDDGLGAPAGPEAYGLDDWSGISIDGLTVTVSRDFVAAAFGIEQPGGDRVLGIFNDDQSFGYKDSLRDPTHSGPMGEITHVGPGSLFEHVGLEPGDHVDAPLDAIDQLAASGQTTATVRRVDGSEDVYTVMLAVE